MTTENARPKGQSWPLYLIAILFVVGVLSVVAWQVELPYLAYSPGPVSDAADAVVAEGVPVYPPHGELLMLTVLSQDVNVFDAVIVGLDPTIDLVRKASVRRQGETDKEYRDRVLQQMDESNYEAIGAALKYLGYELAPEVVINDILPEVPAATLLRIGDTIVSVNGNAITTLSDVGPAMEGLQVGDVVDIEVERDGDTLDLHVELAEREDQPGVPMVGIVLGELVEPPFPISIEEGDVGGPSAGMMHAIAIVDALTEGELTHGRVIAGTGTIDLGGNVGAIGGVRQKVVAAEAAGAEFLLVPRANYEKALTAERHSIEIVPVSTLSEAIAFLDSLETT